MEQTGTVQMDANHFEILSNDTGFVTTRTEGYDLAWSWDGDPYPGIMGGVYAWTYSTVDFECVDVTAISGIDYMSISGTLIYPEGAYKSIIALPPINILNDNTNEPDKVFSFNYVNPTGSLTFSTYEFRISDTLRSPLSNSIKRWPKVENLTLTESGNINGRGNRGHNVMTGNMGNNHLWAGEGNDTLIGGLGADHLFGESEADHLIGIEATFDPIRKRVNASTFSPGRNEIDQLTGGAGRDRFILGESGLAYYNDGHTSGHQKANASLFGLIGRSSDAGWRAVSGGSKFHFGIDFSSNGTPMNFHAGVNGKVIKTGDQYNTITVELSNGNKIEYLHASSIAAKVGQAVTPDTILGKTGGKGPKGRRQFPVHLHVQATDSEGNLIDTDAALLGSDNSYPLEWQQGLSDYAVITDFDPGQDTIQLSGSPQNYRLLFCNKTEGIVKRGLMSVAGTALLLNDANSSSEFKGAELICIIAGKNISGFDKSFVFV
jgi:hypothetical protein